MDTDPTNHQDLKIRVARSLLELVPRLARNIVVSLEDESIGLSLRQFRMLERIRAGVQRTTDLALISAISQPTASAALSSLEGRGLIERSVDKNDRRASLIELTAEGEAMVKAARDHILDRLISIVGEVSLEDAAALERLQVPLVSGMDRARQERLVAKLGENGARALADSLGIPFAVPVIEKSS